MNKLFIVFLLASSTALSMPTEDCRQHYLSLIKNNEELKSLHGGEQVDFFLHPEIEIKNYKSLQKDSKLTSCINKNNNH